jgi:murein L,D-transpeptidase YcbB/YkuD
MHQWLVAMRFLRTVFVIALLGATIAGIARLATRRAPDSPTPETASGSAPATLPDPSTVLPNPVAAIPRFGNSEGVNRALSTYRALAQQPEPPALPTGAPSIHAGEPLPWGAALRIRLETFGDLPVAGSAEASAGASTPVNEVYSPALEAGVKSFQRRHGLIDDGVLGKGTITALNVPVAARVRQLELALARLEALPRDLEGPVIVVNIPMYQLSVWDDVRAATPVMTMKVVVGTPGRYATPELRSTVERVVFRPYWNVPRSIVTGELLPKALADPNYLAAHQYELVRGQTDRSPVVDVSEESLKELELGTLRLRQRPGPGNSLGLIKFDFPNAHDVYLHDTPSKSAFTRDRRALSHGCVRVERPLELASWALETSPESVQESTRGRNGQTVRVPRPVQVLVTYATAWVDADGTVRFAQDIYGRDGRIDKTPR